MSKARIAAIGGCIGVARAGIMSTEEGNSAGAVVKGTAALMAAIRWARVSCRMELCSRKNVARVAGRAFGTAARVGQRRSNAQTRAGRIASNPCNTCGK
jgi:hypothetical protein